MSGITLSAGDAILLRQTLLDAIIAKSELDMLRSNIQKAADMGMCAAVLGHLAAGKAVDIDIGDVAELIQILDAKAQ